MQTAASAVYAIVYLVGVNYLQFELHPRLMKQTLDGATAAGVKRIFLIGTGELFCSRVRSPSAIATGALRPLSFI